MEKVLIDLFVVPEQAMSEFMEAVRKLPPLLRTLPGFVEGYIHQKKSEGGRYNVVTTAVWASDEAFQAARKAAQAEYRRINFNPQEIITRLGVEMERGEFDRMPY